MRGANYRTERIASGVCGPWIGRRHNREAELGADQSAGGEQRILLRLGRAAAGALGFLCLTTDYNRNYFRQEIM